MITIYTTPSCNSCRKVKAWLEHIETKIIRNRLVKGQKINSYFVVNQVNEIMRSLEWA